MPPRPKFLFLKHRMGFQKQTPNSKLSFLNWMFWSTFRNIQCNSLKGDSNAKDRPTKTLLESLCCLVLSTDQQERSAGVSGPVKGSRSPMAAADGPQGSVWLSASCDAATSPALLPPFPAPLPEEEERKA